MSKKNILLTAGGLVSLLAVAIILFWVFGSKKSDREGAKGSYEVFLADASSIGEINPTTELKGMKWMTKEEVLQSLSFPDLKEVFQKAIQSL